MSKVILLLFPVLAVSACGSTEATADFTTFNEEAFMAACTRTGTDIEVGDVEASIDSQIVTDICACVFDATRDDLTFEEFESLDSFLVENRGQAIPAELRNPIADCVKATLEL